MSTSESSQIDDRTQTRPAATASGTAAVAATAASLTELPPQPQADDDATPPIEQSVLSSMLIASVVSPASASGDAVGSGDAPAASSSPTITTKQREPEQPVTGNDAAPPVQQSVPVITITARLVSPNTAWRSIMMPLLPKYRIL